MQSPPVYSVNFRQVAVGRHASAAPSRHAAAMPGREVFTSSHQASGLHVCDTAQVRLPLQLVVTRTPYLAHPSPSTATIGIRPHVTRPRIPFLFVPNLSGSCLSFVIGKHRDPHSAYSAPAILVPVALFVETSSSAAATRARRAAPRPGSQKKNVVQIWQPHALSRGWPDAANLRLRLLSPAAHTFRFTPVFLWSWPLLFCSFLLFKPRTKREKQGHVRFESVWPRMGTSPASGGPLGAGSSTPYTHVAAHVVTPKELN